MLIKTKAIVLRTVKYGDNRLIVDLFTKEQGRLSFAVSVAQSAKGKMKKQFFQPLSLLEVTGDVKPSVQLHRLKEVRLAWPYAHLPFDASKLAITFFIAEFLAASLKGEQRNAALYDYLEGSLIWLDTAREHYANFHLVLMMHVAKFLGFHPNLSGYTPQAVFDLRAGCFTEVMPLHHDVVATEGAAIINTLMRMDFVNMHLFKMSRQQRNELADFLILYYKLHLPAFPELKTKEVLNTLF